MVPSADAIATTDASPEQFFQRPWYHNLRNRWPLYGVRRLDAALHMVIFSPNAEPTWRFRCGYAMSYRRSISALKRRPKTIPSMN